jgi:uncharacterized protein YjbI with pentapeptide repeats
VTIILVIFLSAGALAALFFLIWWIYKRDNTSATTAATSNSASAATSTLGTQLPKAIATIIAIGGFVVTAEQAINTAITANRIAIYGRHQKALESLNPQTNSAILHVGAIHVMGALAKDMPELELTIANELAVAATTYGTKPKRAAPPAEVDIFTNMAPRLSSESQAALEVIGMLPAMKADPPLRLSGGYYHAAVIPFLYFNNVSFAFADLSGSGMFGVQLYGADLRYTLLDGTNLSGARLTNAGLLGATACADFNTVVPDQNKGERVTTTFSGSKLDGANFDKAWLMGTRFQSSKDDKQENRTYVFNATFVDASLRGADFSYAILDYSDLSGADLTDADFTGASVIGIKTDEKTRMCNTKGPAELLSLKHENCPIQDPLPAAKPECVRYLTWREIETKKLVAQPHHAD